MSQPIGWFAGTVSGLLCDDTMDDFIAKITLCVRLAGDSTREMLVYWGYNASEDAEPQDILPGYRLRFAAAKPLCVEDIFRQHVRDYSHWRNADPEKSKTEPVGIVRPGFSPRHAVQFVAYSALSEMPSSIEVDPELEGYRAEDDYFMGMSDLAAEGILHTINRVLRKVNAPEYDEVWGQLDADAYEMLQHIWVPDGRPDNSAGYSIGVCGGSGELLAV